MNWRSLRLHLRSMTTLPQSKELGGSLLREKGADIKQLLCQKHWAETLNRKLPQSLFPETNRYLRKAFYTAINFEEVHHLVWEAYLAVPEKNKEKRAYIQRTIRPEDYSKWASCARFSHPALLQNVTTSPVENFHSMLKRGVKGEMKAQYSLKGTMIRALEVSRLF